MISSCTSHRRIDVQEPVLVLVHFECVAVYIILKSASLIPLCLITLSILFLSFRSKYQYLSSMAEQDGPFYPTINPSSFDLIVLGTGLPESIIAAASAAAGKNVLHLDSNSFYGGHFSSLPLDEFTSILQSQEHDILPTALESPSTSNGNFVSVELRHSSIFSHINISNTHLEDLGSSKKFCLDLSGPRVLFCADPIVDVMVRSGGSHHIEFKCVDGTFVYGGGRDEKLTIVPDSRSAIFKSSSLTLIEKRQLMSFFKIVQEHLVQVQVDTVSASTADIRPGSIPDDDLESPLIEFLTKKGLPSNIKSIILYAIAMADYDQEMPSLRKDLLVRTKDGINTLALHHKSLGRLINAKGALIYPMYGHGELPQAFCRCAAVKGALYVLRMPVAALFIDKESNCYKGVKLTSGQEVFSQQLVVSPSLTVSLSSVISLAQDVQGEHSDNSNRSEVEELVARAVCITRISIKQDLSNLLVIFPPKSLYPEQMTSVRALQCSSTLAVCPPGLFVVYLSTKCDAVARGKESLHAAINALTHLLSGNSESKATVETGYVEESKPMILWSAMYVQKMTKGSSQVITSCPSPDGRLDYRDMLDSTVKLFGAMYPNEKLFPETEEAESTDDDE